MIELAAALALDEAAARLGGELDDGCRGLVINRIVAAGEQGGPCDLMPVFRIAALEAASSHPGPVLLDEALSSRLARPLRWRHRFAPWALASLLAPGERPARDERRLALIEEGAFIGDDVCIGAHSIVRAGAVVGDRCVIEPFAVLMGGVTLGRRVHVGAHAVVGRPGFGWAVGPSGAVARMPHRGGVVVDDDVEIGAHCTVDAGVLAPTRLRRGVKLDAHVHVGHNVDIGEGTLVAAQSGFAGSSRLGRGVLVGGQAGFADHVEVGDQARVAAKAGVIGDIAPGATVAGYPAVDRQRWLRGMAALLGPRRRR